MDEATNDYLQAIGVMKTIEELRRSHLDQRQESYEEGIARQYNLTPGQIREIMDRAMEEHAAGNRDRFQIRKPFGN